MKRIKTWLKAITARRFAKKCPQTAGIWLFVNCDADMRRRGYMNDLSIAEAMAIRAVLDGLECE